MVNLGREEPRLSEVGTLPWSRIPACSITLTGAGWKCRLSGPTPDLPDQSFPFRRLQVIHVSFRVWEHGLELWLTFWIGGLHKAFQTMMKFWRKSLRFYGIRPAFQALRHHFPYHTLYRIAEIKFLQYELKSDKSNASIDGSLHQFQADSLSSLSLSFSLNLGCAAFTLVIILDS